MKRKIYKASGILLAFALMIVNFSCDDKFEDTNKNPNDPEEVPVSSLMIPIIKNSVNSYLGLSWDYGDSPMQHTAKTSSPAIDVYDWEALSGSSVEGVGDPWLTYYNELRNINAVLEIAERDNLMNYKAVMLIMKSWMFHILTDGYGDIPYSEAGTDAFFPKYDTQQSIYASLFTELKTANSLLGSTSEALVNDILYDGDIMKWRKFANSLQIRMLMRLSDVQDPSSGLNEILSNPAQYPVFEGIADQAALSYTTVKPSTYPSFTWRSGPYRSHALSSTLIGKLKELNDPRLEVFALKNIDGEYLGADNGMDVNPEADYSPSGMLWAAEAISDDAIPNAAQTILMDYAELQFILAEAAERGFISGDAEAYYKAGIQASFDYYTERASVFGQSAQPEGFDYYEQAGVVYEGTPQEKLEKIATQKWLDLFHSIEKYYDYKRTGLPVMVPGPDARNDGKMPVRFIYPTSEQALNESSYNEAVNRIGGDNINIRVWWDVD